MRREDKWQAILVQHEENYHQNHWLKVTESIVEWMEEFDQEWLKERRLEFLDNETQKLEEKWQDICQLYWQMSKQDVPYWFRSLLLEDSLPKALAKKTFEKRLVRYGDQLKKGGLTEAEIAKAKDYSFGQLLEVDKNGYGLCPFHESINPHLWVKNNFGYCFVCNWTGDTLKFVMDTKKISFPEAVKLLI